MSSLNRNNNLEKILRKKRKANRQAHLFLEKQKKKKIKTLPKGRGRGSVYFKHHKLSYRLPVVIVFLLMFVFILAIPALIVLPFSNQVTEKEGVDTEAVLDNEEAISVAVMRTKSDVVENVPLENYIVGVVAAEMPVNFEKEALKAQALAARTYAVTHLLGTQTAEQGYDLTDTIQHQVYKSESELKTQWGSDFEENIAKIRAAVQATQGEIITYDEQPIMPAYFSMSNGYTENAEDYWENALPYLRSVESHWEQDLPNLISQETFQRQELAEMLGTAIPPHLETIEMERKESGRVETLKLGSEVFTGREVREKLALRSSDFSIKQKDDHFVFTTKGNGHGVGMSQYGADAMAKKGKTYEEIIHHYYQDIEIDSINEETLTLVSN